jgi:hypothetical protein
MKKKTEIVCHKSFYCRRGAQNYYYPLLETTLYSNSAQNAYQSLSLKVVPKEDNPPNVPQLRPIEDFWYRQIINAMYYQCINRIVLSNLLLSSNTRHL